jgi:hypothetical protein
LIKIFLSGLSLEPILIFMKTRALFFTLIISYY